MDNKEDVRKKLIGTIIGVVVFTALVVGATYAWLTLSADITNGNYATITRNFTITYDGGTAIENITRLSNGNVTKSNITSESTADSSLEDGWIAVSASKAANVARASDFKIMLRVIENQLHSNSLSYVVCRGECPTAELATNVDGEAVCTTDGTTNVVACGTVPYNLTTPTTSATDVVLYNDQQTFNTLSQVSTTTYNIYFWLSSDEYLPRDSGAQFSGYIYASAIQGEGSYSTSSSSSSGD